MGESGVDQQISSVEKVNEINSEGSVVWVAFLWTISFINLSGFGAVLHLPEISVALIYALALILYCRTKTNRKEEKRNFIALRVMPVVVVPVMLAVIPALISGGLDGLSYLSSFAVVYISSKMEIDRRMIIESTWLVGVGGVALMSIYLFGNALDGWDANTMAIFSFFSFLYFSIYLSWERDRRALLLWSLFAAVNAVYVYPTRCRSVMVMMFAAILCVIFSGRVCTLFQRKRFALLLLNIPLLVAIAVVTLESNFDCRWLDTVSYALSGKPLFSFRDMLWGDELDSLKFTDFLGYGYFKFKAHNSAVAALTAFGVVGYLAWIAYFAAVISRLRTGMCDPVVYGCFASFAIIYVHQSAELGFISTAPNYLPYLMLGMALAVGSGHGLIKKKVRVCR
jgi:hypothetical protein